MPHTDIYNLIPHREPFLFVDEVLELSARRIVTTKFADPQAEFFKGHYPGNPVMPGVLLCECCFQAGAILAGTYVTHGRGQPGTPVITRIKEAKFKHMVRPGETLQVEVTLDEELHDVLFMTARVQADGTLALRLEFAATLVAEPAT